MAIPPQTQHRITPAFKLVFVGVFSLFMVLFISNIALAFAVAQPPPPVQKELIENIARAWQGCLTAMVGLLGGKLL